LNEKLLIFNGEGKRKYNYFIMGFAGAAIAFSMHQTADLPWEPRMIIWILAVILWSGCIVYGLVYEQNSFSRLENALIKEEELAVC